MTTKTKSQENHKMSEIDDHILKYFDIKKRLGKGAYGIVWKAIDKKTSQTLAVKKIFDAFRDETDAQRTFREIMFLRAFRNHPNVIQLHNVYKATNNLDIYLSFEFMESDLHNVIKKGNILKDVHKRYIMYQLLNATKYIHSGNVIHRDLKPSNVLIDTKCRCKLADFGLARSVSSHQMRDSNEPNEQFDPVLTDYVATRWYRAPEILVASKRYTKGIDMWSLGCILGEMIRGKPIFQGSSTVNQIEKIVSALPEITEQDILAVGAGFGTALLNKQISSNSNVKTLDDLLIDGTDDGNDLVKRLLVLDPLARLTATEALNHKYVEKFRHSIQETELNVDVRPPFRDDVRLSVSEYRSKLYEIVQQTEKAPSIKPTSYNRKREPRSNNRSMDSIPTKYINSDEKVKRSICRSQERKSYIPQHSNEAAIHFKTPPISSSNKLTTPPASNSGTIPKPHCTSSLSNEQSQTDPRVQPMLSRTKYFIKPTKNRLTNSVTKNTTSSPEVNSMQRTQSRSRKLVLDKRHSIDGSYDCGEAICAGNTVNHMNVKDKLSNTLHNSYSSLSKQNEKPTNPSSRMRRGNQNVYVGHRNSISSPHYIESCAKVDAGLKFEDYTDINGGSNYYEKRLRRLEEQIERHKREVKAYCSEKSKYSKSTTFHRNTDPSNQDKYSTTSSGSGKSSELCPRVANNSYKNCQQRGSTSRFEYLYAGGDDIGYRQENISKNGDRKPSKII